MTWAKKFGWNRSKTRRFLLLLENDSMIELKSDNKTTYLTVCNYETYQNGRTSNEHQMNIKRTSNEHQMDTNKELKRIKKKEKEYTSNFIWLRSRWEMIVNLYPNLNDIQSAARVWNQIKVHDQLAMDIIEAIKKQKESGQLPNNNFCPLLKNYLRNERWKDTVNSTQKEFTYDQILKKIDEGEKQSDYQRQDNGLWIRRS